MGNKEHRGRKRRKSRRAMQHKLSVIVISGVVLMLIGVLSVGSLSLQKKNEKYKRQEAKLEAQILKEEERAEEIAELGEYIHTDEYAAEVAKDKLGLVYPDEIYFEAE